MSADHAGWYPRDPLTITSYKELTMAKRDDTREVCTPSMTKQTRTLKVQLQQRGNEMLPCIRLHGKWLGWAGFSPGCKVQVHIMEDCLVITKECDIESIRLATANPKKYVMKKRVTQMIPNARYPTASARINMNPGNRTTMPGPAAH